MEIPTQTTALKLTPKAYTTIALSAGVGEKLVRRIVRSITIQCRQKSSEQGEGSEGPGRREVGFRLLGGEPIYVSADLSKDAIVTSIAIALKEYNACCPLVLQWIGRGDFDPRRPPKELQSSHILHATRTAGRVRASLLRRLNRKESKTERGLA